MTLPTPETLPRHELAGLRVEVVDAPNPDLVGIAGRVVRETTNTLVIRVAEATHRCEDEAAHRRDDATDAAIGRDDATAAHSGATVEHDGAAAECDGTSRGRHKRVPKAGTTFEFALPATAETEPEVETKTEAEEEAELETDAEAERNEAEASGPAGEPAPTDEAAATREGAGTASKRRSETAGTGATRGAGQSCRCEGVAYVTVDGARLLSRPARRTETGGRSKWR